MGVGLVWSNWQETKQERKRRFYWGCVSTCSVLSSQASPASWGPVHAASGLDAHSAPAGQSPLLYHHQCPSHLPVPPLAPLRPGTIPGSSPSPDTLAFCLSTSSRATQRRGSRLALWTPTLLGLCRYLLTISGRSQGGLDHRPLGFRGQRGLRGLCQPSPLVHKAERPWDSAPPNP